LRWCPAGLLRTFAGWTPAQFADEMRRELALWKDLAQKTGIRID